MKDSIKYNITRGNAPRLTFKDVVFEGLASDGGLYIPEYWLSLSKDAINSFPSMTYQEIAYAVISPYIDSSLTEKDLKDIIDKSYSCFDTPEITPLKKLNNEQVI